MPGMILKLGSPVLNNADHWEQDELGMKKRIAAVFLMALFALLPLCLAMQAENNKQECPSPDATHRYIMVPLVYASPQLGTFRLYYETNTDFNPKSKTVFFLYDGQQLPDIAGDPDNLKKKYGLETMNVVRMEHRGMPWSRIDAVFTKDGVDWKKAWDYFRSENVVEDIDRIRIDLLGENDKVFLVGGSGSGILACQYLAKYSVHVERASISIATDNVPSANQRQMEKFFNILKNEGAMDDYLDILNRRPVPELEFLWILQRMEYDFPPSERKGIELIRRLQAGDTSLYKRYAETYGDVEEFVERTNAETPFAAVRLFEMFFDTLEFSPKVPAYGLIKPMTLPLRKLAEAGVVHPEAINVRPSLAAIQTEALLVAARWDHVIPYLEMVEMKRNMAQARLLIMDDLHVLKNSRECLLKLIRSFLENGAWSPEFEKAMASSACPLWKE